MVRSAVSVSTGSELLPTPVVVIRLTESAVTLSVAPLPSVTAPDWLSMVTVPSAAVTVPRSRSPLVLSTTMS